MPLDELNQLEENLQEAKEAVLAMKTVSIDLGILESMHV